MSLKKAFITGVYYTALAKYSVVIINLIVVAILSRKIPPNDFRIIAIAMVFILFFEIISNIGIGTAIVQKKELSKKDISSIFSLTIYIAIISTIIFFFASSLIANYYSEPILKSICQLVCISLFFSICNIVPNSLLLKEKQFKYITFRTFSVQLIGGIISIIALYSGFGIYSLLINPIFSAIAIFIINYIKNPIQFSFGIQKSSIQKIFSYSIFQFLFSLINYFSRNLDNILIGKYLGMNQLGYYEKSYKLMTLSFSNISNVFTSVIHPVFSDMQDNLQRMSENYLKIIRLLAIIGFPLSVFLFFNAEELILLMFQEQWINSIVILKVLSLSIGFQMIVSSAGPMFQATNSTKLLFIDGLISTSIIVISLIIGLFLFESLFFVALLISLSYIINSFKSLFILSHYVLKMKMIVLLKEVYKPIFIALILAVALFFVDFANISLILSLIIKTCISLLVVASLIHIFGIYDLKSLIKNGLEKR